MKLEELRARLRFDTCACCHEVEHELIEHAQHGHVCAWCRDTCYDVLADVYDHTQAFLRTDSVVDEMKCACCGRFAENARHHSVHGIVCGWCGKHCYDFLRDAFEHTHRRST